MNLTILGGGSAGWLTALYIKQLFKNSNVTLIERKNIPIIGVGEATTPHIVSFLSSLNIDYKEVIKKTDGTLKNGISFENWNGDNKKYLHGFSLNGHLSMFDNLDYLKQLINNKLPFVDYTYQSQLTYQNKINLENQSVALHFDANKFATYLSEVGKQRNINHIIDDYKTCVRNDLGFIKELKTTNHNIKTDFVFDCSGFQKLIIGNLYQDTWIDYQKHLPMKKAMLFPTQQTNDKPYTTARALKYGWVFEIPLQNRLGRGYIFDSDYINEDQAVKELEENYSDVNPIRTIEFKPGRFQNAWIKNCIGIGLSTNFIEPLESTSIYMTIAQLELLKDFKDYIEKYNPNKTKIYNEIIANNNDAVLNFIYLHYVTKRKDSKFWKDFRKKNIMPNGMDKILEDINSNSLDNYSLPRFTSASFCMQSYLKICEGLGMFYKCNKTNNINLRVYDNVKKIAYLHEQNHIDFINHNL